MPGLFELLLLLAILVMVYGAKRLPDLGSALGRMVVNYRQASKSRSEIKVERADDDERDEAEPDQRDAKREGPAKPEQQAT